MVQRLTIFGAIALVIATPFLAKGAAHVDRLSLFLLFGFACTAVGFGIGKMSCDRELSRLRHYKEVKQRELKEKLGV